MNKFRSSLLALALAMGGASATAGAQEGAGEGQPQPKAEQGGGGDMLARAETIQSRGQALSGRIQGMLDAARRDGDIVKVTCLNDKLTQSNATLRTVQQRVGALRNALAVNDTAAANHEFTVLTVLGQKFSTLDQEANQCVGQDMFEPGSAQVVTQVDPNTVPSDVNATSPTSPPPAPPSVTLPPPLSPTE